VVRLALALGFQILIVPSQLLDRNVSLATRFQCTEKTSRACSCHDCTGNSERLISKSLTEPSPPAVRSWFSLDSDHVTSKSESWVSNLGNVHCQAVFTRIVHVMMERKAHHFSATIPFGVRPNMYTRPFPTRPKLADAATAIRESKNGEYLTL
jgi:hypothetical protein